MAIYIVTKEVHAVETWYRTYKAEVEISDEITDPELIYAAILDEEASEDIDWDQNSAVSGSVDDNVVTLSLTFEKAEDES